MKKIFYILILLFSTASLNAQGVRVYSRLDTNKLLIGEQTRLHLSVEYAAESGITEIIFPTIYDTINQHIEILSKNPIDTLIPDKNEPFLLQQKQELLITSFDSGYYVIPPFQFIINADTFETEATLLEVYSLPVDTSEAIFDVKQPIEEPFSFKDWLKENWKWIAIGLVLIVLIILLIRYLKNRKPTEKVKEIIAKCEEINGLSIDQLRALKKEVRSAERTSDQKGGNIGLIQVALKSEHPLQVEFKEIDDKNSYFIISSTIEK